MRFGWQGFKFDHPDDWAPVTLTGQRKQGYVRLASPGTASVQVRWTKGTPKQLETTLDTYFAKLRADAKRARVNFECRRDPDEGLVGYQYTGIDSARGILFHQASCGRIFFVEALGKPRDNLKGFLKELITSFESPNSSPEAWSLLGLSLKLPYGLNLNRSELRAGKTSLWLSQGKVNLRAERWGLAEQLLAKHPFEDWCQAVLGFRNPQVRAEEPGLRLTEKSLFSAREAILSHEPDQNQIVLVESNQVNGTWKPEWSWLS